MSLPHGEKKNEENNSRCPLNGNRLRCLSPIILETSPDVATAGNQLTAEIFSETFHPLKRLTVGVRLNDTTRANKHARKKNFFFPRKYRTISFHKNSF